MKLIILVIGLFILFILIYVYCGRPSGRKTIKESQYGPFTIRAEANEGKTFNMNYGMVKTTSVRYSIWLDGKEIEFPGTLQTNTGLPYLWKVYVLKDAQTPTLIAGSQSLYLIYLNGGHPVVQPIYTQGSDFATLQFLDYPSGQPGTEISVFSVDDATDMEKPVILQGGRYLLVSGHVVLDVSNLHAWKFNINNNDIDNYTFPSPPGALAFSPDRKGIVFNGEFQSWNTETKDLPDSEHALVVYHYEADEGYIVKYDDTETRLKGISDISIEWFNQFFEWTSTAGAAQKLQLKFLLQKPNWSGKYTEKDNYYILYPVNKSMLPVFLEFVLSQMNWTKDHIIQDETGEYTGRVITLGDNDTKLDLRFKEDEQTISFSKYLYLNDGPENSKYLTIIKKIADAFDHELSLGKYQEHFGKIISETKHIRSL